MGDTVGYVGSIEVETRGHDRIWFSLTERDTGSQWVEKNGRRAGYGILNTSACRMAATTTITTGPTKAEATRIYAPMIDTAYGVRRSLR